MHAFERQIAPAAFSTGDIQSRYKAVRAIERLITQDKVDLLLPPWGTAVNLAVAPLFDKHGYPQIGSTNLTHKADQFAKRWPGHFFLLGSSGMYADALMDVLGDAKKEGKIGKKVAMISVADGFGVDSASAARKAAAKHGFELVLDKTYPVGSSDLSSLLNEAKASGADTFGLAGGMGGWHQAGLPVAKN